MNFFQLEIYFYGTLLQKYLNSWGTLTDIALIRPEDEQNLIINISGKKMSVKKYPMSKKF